MTRYYRVDWILHDRAAFRRRYKVEPRETGGVLFPGPLTHEQARTCMRKTTAYDWRRLVLVEVTE